MPNASNVKEEFIFQELQALQEDIEGTDGLPEDLREKTFQMLDRLNRMAKLGHYAAEFDTLSRYIQVITSIPWSKRTKDNLNLAEAKEILDRNHYGMEEVKERLLEYLATIKLRIDREVDTITEGQDVITESPVLLFVGLQGIGKTTLAMSIADALGREFIRISMGALGTPLELRGRSKVFAEAEPGQIVKALIKTQVRNPVILLDEIDKASGEQGLRTDIMAVMLELLDPNQNNSFRDHYVDYPLDLSEVMFICSANNTGTITTALMDRLEVIKMTSYTDEEKVVIARDYLMVKIIKKNGLKPGEIEIDPNLWPSIIRPFGFDSGIRSISRTLDAMCRKVAKEIVEGKSQKVVITEQNLKYYLPK